VLVGSATAWFTRRQAAHRKVPFPTLTLTLQDLLEPGPQPPMATMVGQEPAAATISLDPERVVLDPILPVEALPREQPDLSAPLIPPTPPPVDAHLPAASRGAGSGATPGLAAGHGFTQGSGRTRFRGVPGMTPDLDLKDLEVIHEEIPTYPWMAELAHVQGDVVVRVTLNEQGVPIHTELIEGPPALQAETMRAVKHWRFGKGIFRGKKVEATFDMVFRYILR
jgi:TonB family protein